MVNLIASAFLLGSMPEHYWVWQAIKCVIMMIVAFVQRKKRNMQLFMLDFCWIVSISYSLYGLVNIATALGHFESGTGSLGLLFRDWFGLAVTVPFRAFFAIANGPLAMASIVLGNALVLHDTWEMSMLFIHISPCLCSWSMRWNAPALVTAYPTTFAHGGLPASDAAAATVSLADIWLPGLAIYTAHWMLYSVWLLMYGRKESIARTGRDTVYHTTMTRNPGVVAMTRLLIGRVGDDVTASKRAAVMYQSGHFLSCALILGMPYALWHSFRLHTAWCVALVLLAVWRGATKYYKMMTLYYVRRMQQLIDSYDETTQTFAEYVDPRAAKATAAAAAKRQVMSPQPPQLKAKKRL